jgi:type IV pilus assembly protein PilP
MTHGLRSLLTALLAGLLLLGGAGCGDKKADAPPPPRRGAEAAKKAAETDAGAEAAAPAIAFREEDFVETELSRDPFRSFSRMFADENKAAAKTQREVLLDRYSIDVLKLVGIVTGTAEHRAMLVDPTGTGWIVHRGQFIGKAEVVRGSGSNSASYELNWRVDRIRDGDIVLVREDPAHSDIPPATRVIPLRPEETAAITPSP